ncbi:MAG TPA: hypothetical protein VFW68_14930 [Rhodocyclaceae bacterium]|nr:hypothetical protein [Rhodocyclaceae bacterium]
MSHPVQVCVALYPKLHSASRLTSEAEDESWSAGLPALWRDAVVVPLDYRSFRDYEVQARRVVGYDESGEPCFSRYTYRHDALRSDDGEEFYEEIVHAEIGRSWRLRDGRWLTWRRVEHGWGEERGFFSFSEEMPR